MPGSRGRSVTTPRFVHPRLRYMQGQIADEQPWFVIAATLDAAINDAHALEDAYGRLERERDEARQEAEGERHIAGMIRANYCGMAREAASLLAAAGAPGAAAMFEQAAEQGPGV